jgi:putative tryptophan/tyrosine transport system substrate-binding protein
MRRREFIAGLGGIAASTLGTQAQQRAMPVIGFLASMRPDPTASEPFRKGLAQAGYVEGRNIAVEDRWADNRYDRLPALATELIDRRVSVIYATPTPAALAAKRATATIPIVFMLGADPVKLGLVASLNRPGGNITGISALSNEVTQKNLQILHELLPQAGLIGFLVNPANQNAEADTKDAMAAAEILGVQLMVLRASDQGGVEAAFVALAQQRIGALLVSSDAAFTDMRDHVVAIAARYRIPAIYDSRGFPEAGGLMSYGPNWADAHQAAGVYVGRILKGDKPTDLPVQRATRLEMVLNLKTAKTLGIEVPPSVLLRADEVIE